MHMYVSASMDDCFISIGDWSAECVPFYNSNS